MRRIYCVGIAHTWQEMVMKEHMEEKLKEQGAFFKKIETYMEEIEEYLKEKSEIFKPEFASRLNIFIDSLHQSFSEEDIAKWVSDRTNKGITLYRIISQLIKLGAKVHGTEDLDLHNENLRLLKKIVSISKGEQHISSECEKHLLREVWESVRKRNAAIAGRIDAVAQEEDNNILFIGYSHFRREYNIITDLKNKGFLVDLIIAEDFFNDIQKYF